MAKQINNKMINNKKKPFEISEETLKDLEIARNSNFTSEEIDKTKEILDKNV